MVSKKQTLTKQNLPDLAGLFAEKAKKRICANPKRVLLLPPDTARAHSGAGLWSTAERLG
ncbi:hypothetical protein FACS189443_7000 [Planctomycetales bacterium]|nr:hypothetical protein FACS189443_7000 [Planctomycetales bacterium]